MNNKILTQWSRMGPRAMFGQFMIDIAKKNKDLMVISADLGRSSGLDRFKAAFPNKYLSVGICEQNHWNRQFPFERGQHLQNF